MGNSFITVAPDSTGKKLRTVQRTVGGTVVEDQSVVVNDSRDMLGRARASTFRISGIAATTTAYNLQTLYNAHATKMVDVNRIMVDTYSTVGRLATVPPPIVRVSRLTGAPSAGTAVTKTLLDTGDTTDAAITSLQATASDGGALTPITATPAAGPLTQEFASRLLNPGGTATGNYAAELCDRMEFFAGAADITLRANQGIVIHLAGPSGSILTTDNFIVTVDWEEYTLP